jgi:gamma-glutamyl:cysteine ligase YbdK (ATP-grasp superfamily)
MHNIIALKKPGDKYTVELRSPDGINSPKQLQTIVQFTKCLVANALKFAKK